MDRRDLRGRPREISFDRPRRPQRKRPAAARAERNQHAPLAVQRRAEERNGVVHPRALRVAVPAPLGAAASRSSGQDTGGKVVRVSDSLQVAERRARHSGLWLCRGRLRARARREGRAISEPLAPSVGVELGSGGHPEPESRRNWSRTGSAESCCCSTTSWTGS